MVRNGEICCAYLYIISRYGYPPPVQDTAAHIAEMAKAGFRHLELEGIGAANIRYLYTHREEVADALVQNGCRIPVLCTVLPGLGSGSASERTAALEAFEMGCETAQYLGAGGVLDNGPLLPLDYPANMPVMRHYNGHHLASLLPPASFHWDSYWEDLTGTFRAACSIAARYGLDYHLHPCEGSLTTGTDSFLLFANAVGAPNLRFCLDTANQFAMGDNLPLSLIRLAGRVSYIHISDNGGDWVEHLPPGQGNIHWDNFFSTLAATGFNGTVAIDVGGAESHVPDLAQAYHDTARWLGERLARCAAAG